MKIDGNHVYFDEKARQQPNHARVVRMLRQMDCEVHAERRSTNIYTNRDRRTGPSALALLTQTLRQALQ